MGEDGSAGPYGVDTQGFVPLTTLQEAARSRSQEEFEALYPVPGLFIELAAGDGEAEEAGSPQDRALQTLSLPGADFLYYVGRVGLVVKRPDNPFPRMISVGRTATNDLVINVGSISKFHGYFDQPEGVWCFTDHNSTNGSWLNGSRLEANCRERLSSGDRLRLGLDVEVVFLLPEALYSRLSA